MRVLLVEGDSTQREVLRRDLEAEGYRVRTVGDGLTAIMEVLRSSPDLVVLDPPAGGPDGAHLIERLRHVAGAGKLPIVLVSDARPRSLDPETRHLPRPVNRADLLQIVRDILSVPVA
jgi:DNA-binding response OmpR family regulator